MSSLASLASYADQSDEDEQDGDLSAVQVGSVQGNLDRDEELKMPETAWQQIYDPATGYPYYWNTQTNEITWEPPEAYLAYLSALSDYAVKMELKKEEEQKRKQEKKQAKKEAKAKKEGAITLISSYGGETTDESESEESLSDTFDNKSSSTKRVEYGPPGPPVNNVEYGPVGPPETSVEYGPVNLPDALGPSAEQEYGPAIALEKSRPITPIPDALTTEESADVILGPEAPPTPELATNRDSDTEPTSKSALTFSELESKDETTIDSIASEIPADEKKTATFFIGDKSDEDDLMSILDSEKPPDYKPDKEVVETVSRLETVQTPDVSEPTPVPSSDDLMELIESEKPPDYDETLDGSPKKEFDDDLMSVLLAERPPDYSDSKEDSTDVLDLIKDEVPPDQIDEKVETVTEKVELTSEVSNIEDDVKKEVKPSYDDLLAEFYEELEHDLKGVEAESEKNKEVKQELVTSISSKEVTITEPTNPDAQIKVSEKTAEDDLLAQFYAELESEEIKPSETPKPQLPEPSPAPVPVVVKPPKLKKKMTKAESRELMKTAKSAFTSVGALPVLAEPEDVEKMWDFSQVAAGEASSDNLGQYQGGSHRGFGFHGTETTPYIKKGFVKFSKGETLEPIAAGVFEVIEPSPPIPMEDLQSVARQEKVEAAVQTDQKIDKLLDPNLTSVMEDLVERLVILEVEKVKVDPLKILALQADTLFCAWQEGALESSYLQQWVEKSLSVMERYEKFCVAPQGWNVTWDSTNKRYVYENTTTKEIKYTKPEEGKEDKTPAKSKPDKPSRISDVSKIPTPGSSAGSKTARKPTKRKPSPPPDFIVISPPPPPTSDLTSSPVPPPPSIAPPSPSAYGSTPPPPPAIYVSAPSRAPPPRDFRLEEPSRSSEWEGREKEREKLSWPAAKKARTVESKPRKKPSAFKMMSKWQDIQNQYK